jgi:predicted RNase H-like HicB family nuclease
MKVLRKISGYTVEIQDTYGGGWVAYAVDLPAVMAGGDTFGEVKQRMREGIHTQIEILVANGMSIPEPRAEFETI